MEVAVDEARHREQAARIDRPRERPRKRLRGARADGDDAGALDDDVGLVPLGIRVIEREHPGAAQTQGLGSRHLHVPLRRPVDGHASQCRHTRDESVSGPACTTAVLNRIAHPATVHGTATSWCRRGPRSVMVVSLQEPC
jgi:hypothetical protein